MSPSRVVLSVRRVERRVELPSGMSFSSSRVAEFNVFSSVHFTSSCRLHSHVTAVIFSRGVIQSLSRREAFP